MFLSTSQRNRIYLPIAKKKKSCCSILPSSFVRCVDLHCSLIVLDTFQFREGMLSKEPECRALEKRPKRSCFICKHMAKLMSIERLFLKWLVNVFTASLVWKPCPSTKHIFKKEIIIAQNTTTSIKAYIIYSSLTCKSLLQLAI